MVKQLDHKITFFPTSPLLKIRLKRLVEKGKPLSKRLCWLNI